MRIRLVLFIAVLLPSYFAEGQEPYFKNYSQKNGLISSSVYCVIQDSKGYMWFGTDLGASRFNGYEFQNFSYSDGLIGNEVIKIHEDKNGRLWFLALNGQLSIYDGKTWYNSENHSQLKSIDIQSMHTGICELQDGGFYLSSLREGVFKVDQSEQAKKIDLPEGRTYAVWNQEEIYALGSYGIAKFNLKKDSFHIIQSYPFLDFFPRIHISNTTTFIGYGEQLFEFKDSLFLIEELAFSEDITVIEKHLDQLYIGSRTGGFQMNIKEQKAQRLPYLEGKVITDFFWDNNNGYWVTTLEDGIFYSPRPQLDYYPIYVKDEKEKIITILLDEVGKVWMGSTIGNIYCLDTNDHIEKIVTSASPQPVSKIRKYKDNIYVCKKNELVVLGGASVFHLPYLVNDILFFEDEVIIASNKLFKMKVDDFNTQLLDKPLNHSETQTILDQHVISDLTGFRCLEKNNKGRILIGTNAGLLELKNGILERVDFPFPYSNVGQVNDIKTVPNSEQFILGTSNLGALQIFENRVLSQHRHPTSGIENVNKIYPQGAQKFFMISSTELLEVTLTESNPYTNINTQSGLDDVVINDLCLTNDSYFLATDQGIFRALNHSSRYKDHPPAIFLNEVKVNNEIKSRSLTHELNHNQNSISFHFIALSYGSFGKTKYHYRLKGHQDKWSSTTLRQVRYEALSPGNYTFEVFAETSKQVHSKTLNHSFTIQKPFWARLWFFVLIMALLTSIVFWVYKLRLSAVRKRFKMEKDRLLAEQKARVYQMNPHFIFNSLNSIKGFYSQHNIAGANKFLAKFSKLLRLVLENESATIKLKDEIKLLELYIELLKERYDHKFDYKIHLEGEIDTEIIIPAMILQPIVENGIIHGIAPHTEGMLDITFEVSGRVLTCIIMDDGIGIHENAFDRSGAVGINNIKERLEIFSSEYKNTFKMNIASKFLPGKKGTKIILELPILNKYDQSNNH